MLSMNQIIIHGGCVWLWECKFYYCLFGCVSHLYFRTMNYYVATVTQMVLQRKVLCIVLLLHKCENSTGIVFSCSQQRTVSEKIHS